LLSAEFINGEILEEILKILFLSTLFLYMAWYICIFWFRYCVFSIKNFFVKFKNKKNGQYGSSNFHTYNDECTEIKNHFAKITESIMDVVVCNFHND